jgi:hypothetical protein
MELDAEAQLFPPQTQTAAADAADDGGPLGEPRTELDFNELPPTTVSTVITKLRAPKCFRLRSRGELVCCWVHVTWRGLTSTNPPVPNSS